MTEPLIKINFGKLEKLVKKGVNLAPGMRHAISVGAFYFKGKWSVYPPSRPQVYQPSRRWTAKQRRGFWAKLKKGEIEVPYRRGLSPGSQRLAQRFAYRMVSDFEAVVGNNATYAPLVLSYKKQAFYHKGNWTTDREAKQKYGKETGKIIRTTFVAWLEKQ